MRKIWKEVVIDKLRCCPRICVEGPRKAMKILVSEVIFKPSYPEYKCRAFSLHQPFQYIEGMELLR
jgi:hypothetical protein